MSDCRYCDEGNPRIRSSVTDAFVHTDTPVGRVVCKNKDAQMTDTKPSDEKRLTEDELKLLETPYGYLSGEPTEAVFLRIHAASQIRAQATELVALKEPMACGHPRACWISMQPQGSRTYRGDGVEENMGKCLWCESEKALRERAEKAEASLYVPGHWSCPKCGFVLVSSIFYAQSGNIGANGEKPEPCPNDGTEMAPRTWEQSAKENSDGCMKYAKELRAAEAERDRLAQENEAMKVLAYRLNEDIADFAEFIDLEKNAKAYQAHLAIGRTLLKLLDAHPADQKETK